MRHTRSAAEWEIRNAVVAKLRRELPDARVVHGMVAGGCRSDIAAIEQGRVLLFEIKSENDTLSRVERQMKHFATCGHAAVLVAHDKHFDHQPYDNGRPRCVWPRKQYSDWLSYGVWRFPEEGQPEPRLYRWRLPRRGLVQPHARRILELLGRDEMKDLALGLNVSVSSRDTIPKLIDQIAWLATGQEICRGVCAALRSRAFAEADDPCQPMTDGGLTLARKRKQND